MKSIINIRIPRQFDRLAFIAKQHQLILMALKPGLFQPPMVAISGARAGFVAVLKRASPTCRGARWFFGGIGTGRR